MSLILLCSVPTLFFSAHKKTKSLCIIKNRQTKSTVNSQSPKREEKPVNFIKVLTPAFFFICVKTPKNKFWHQNASFLATDIEQHVANSSVFIAHFGVLVAHFGVFKAKFFYEIEL